VERLRTADNLPIFLENMFFPYQTYRGLMTEDLNNRSIFQVMKQIDGRTVNDTSRRTLEIAKASPKQAQKLGISTGEPLLFMNCYFIDQEGHPLCIGRQYYVGSRYMFEL
jgi:GntR family transcriptional regulator